MNRTHRRVLLTFLLLLALLLAILVVLTWREMNQERLNQALIAAVKARNESLAIRLLNRGADPNSRDVAPPQLSVWKRFWTLIPHPNAPVRDQALTALALVFDLDPWNHRGHGRPDNELPRLVLALLQHGADPNVTDEEGTPVLVTASRFGYANCVRLLLQHGADIRAQDIDGQTALMAGSDYFEIFKLLLASGADVEQTNKRDGRAIHYVVGNFRPWTRTIALRALLKRGADINAADHLGRTALMYSAEEGDVDTKRLLLAAHARWDYRDRDGLTALDLARQGMRQIEQGRADCSAYSEVRQTSPEFM